MYYRKQIFNATKNLKKYCGIRSVSFDNGGFKIGSQIEGFTVEKIKTFNEIQTTLINFKHDKTRASYYHAFRDDNNKTFSVSFRTSPTNSTGLPHILEHLVLCGSKKYPCRDPFFQMLSRSISNFMNAMTYPDQTTYLFATTNSKDFSNLLSVYLDCVFNPLLRSEDFKQEAWRLEKIISENSDKYELKGVVFNEMKGLKMDADNLFVHKFYENILSSGTYSHNSGGEPLDIPKLTLDDLKVYHKNHYHPSNSISFSYGSLDVLDMLKKLNNEYFSHFTFSDYTTFIPKEPTWTQPKCVVFDGPPDTMSIDSNKSTMFAVGFKLNENDSYDTFVNQIVSSLLLDGPSSPFYKSLIESNIGSDYCSATGYHRTTKDHLFGVGLRGINACDIPKIILVIDETLQKTSENGFDKKDIDGLLHSMEYSLKRVTTKFGLRMSEIISKCWNHNIDPFESLSYNSLIERFKTDLNNDSSFLQNWIRKNLIENKHKLSLTMHGKDSYKLKFDDDISKLLTDVKNSTVKESTALPQKNVDDSNSLPQLSISDLDNAPAEYTLDEHVLGDNVSLQICCPPCNELVHFKALSLCNHLPYSDKAYLPLFANVFTKMGCGEIDHRALSQEIQLYCGEFNCDVSVLPSIKDSNDYELALLFESSSFERNFPKVLELWLELFTKPNLNNSELLKTLVTSYFDNLSTSIIHSAHQYAVSAAASHVNASSMQSELINGLSQIKFLKNIITNIETNITSIIENLSEIAANVLDQTTMRCSLNVSESYKSDALSHLGNFFQYVPEISSVVSSNQSNIKQHNFLSQKTFINIESPVFYNALVLKSCDYLHDDYISLKVLCSLISRKYLHKRIREVGGAYGSNLSQNDGYLAFSSYRDPYYFKTLDVFNSCKNWIINDSFTDQDINEAKLSVISKFDQPRAPHHYGQSFFFNRISNELKNSKRSQVLTVDRANLREMAIKYLSEDAERSIVVIGHDKNFDNQNNEWNHYSLDSN